MKATHYFLIGVSIFAGVCDVRAEESIGFGFASKHQNKYSHTGLEYNEQNVGFSYEHRHQSYSHTVGYYRNSVHRNTFYGAVGYRILEVGKWSVTPVAGLFTGYKTTVTAGALGVIQYDVTARYALQFVFVPPIANEVHGVVALGLKYKF